MDEQVLIKKVFSDVVLGHHAFNSSSDNLGWVFFNKVFHENFLKSTRVASVMSVKFLILLSSSDFDIRSIHNDDSISEIEPIVSILRLMLSSNEYCDLSSHST